MYNFKHRRWEAALVMPRSRRCRRSSLLRICNASQLQSTRRSPYRQAKKHDAKSKNTPQPAATETLVSLRRTGSPGKPSSSSSSSQSPAKDQAVPHRLVLAYDREISALARCSQLAVTGTRSEISDTVRLSTDDKGLSKVEAWRQFPHYLRVRL